jgi:hypothetical protein
MVNDSDKEPSEDEQEAPAGEGKEDDDGNIDDDNETEDEVRSQDEEEVVEQARMAQSRDKRNGKSNPDSRYVKSNYEVVGFSLIFTSYRNPQEYPRVAPPTKERIAERIPKDGRKLAQYPGVRFGPKAVVVKFGEWSDSAYVHGHGTGGRFAFDDDHGQLMSNRLVGFHDSFKRHHGKDYLNSWIVLPRASKGVLDDLWTALSELLNCKALAFDDSYLRRCEPGTDIQEILYVSRVSE